MNEQQQQEMPEVYMSEIIRFFSKLKHEGLTSVDLTMSETKKVVNNKLEITVNLKAGDVVVASNINTVNKSLEAVKAVAEEQKAALQAQAAAAVAEVDSVISVIDEELKKA